MPADSIKNAITASIEEVTGDDPIQAHDEGGEPIADDLPPIEDEIPEPDPADAAPADDAEIPEPAKEPAKPATEVKPDKPAEGEDFAKEHGIKAKDKHGRENKIPYSVVSGRIVPNAVKKERTKWDTEVLAPVTAKVKTYEDRLGRIAQTETIMLGYEDPKTGHVTPPDEVRFLKMLAATQGTKYAELLAPVLTGAAAPAAGAKPSVSADDPEPTPDAEVNGQPGYSKEQFAKLRQWERRQAVKEAREEISKEFKPIKDAFGAHQETREREQQLTNLLDRAWQWPGFAENNDAILRAFNADTTNRPISEVLQAAYHTTIYGKAKAVPDTAAIEAAAIEKFKAALRTAPRATSAGGGSGSSAAGRQDAADEEAAKNPTRAAILASIRR